MRCSNLEKNQELKAVILEKITVGTRCTDETEQKKHHTLLFDLNKMRGTGTKKYWISYCNVNAQWWLYLVSGNTRQSLLHNI